MLAALPWLVIQMVGLHACEFEDNGCSAFVGDTIIKCGSTDVCEEDGCTPLVGDTDGGSANVVISVTSAVKQVSYLLYKYNRRVCMFSQ